MESFIESYLDKSTSHWNKLDYCRIYRYFGEKFALEKVFFFAKEKFFFLVPREKKTFLHLVNFTRPRTLFFPFGCCRSMSNCVWRLRHGVSIRIATDYKAVKVKVGVVVHHHYILKLHANERLHCRGSHPYRTHFVVVAAGSEFFVIVLRDWKLFRITQWFWKVLRQNPTQRPKSMLKFDVFLEASFEKKNLKLCIKANFVGVDKSSRRANE